MPSETGHLSGDVALIQAIPAVPVILDVLCRTTGMGFAAVARVTESRWVACSVLDRIQFGLEPGGELRLETTICHEIREHRTPVIIGSVECDDRYRHHHTPLKYGFQSYISVPILLSGGRFFGTLCAIDPKPARISDHETGAMFRLFADLIAFHIEAAERLARSETLLQATRETSELREQFIGVLGHDLRNPLNALSMGAQALKESPLEEEDMEVVGMMERSIARMSGLIDDALDLTRGRLGGGIALGEKFHGPVGPLLRQVIAEAEAAWPGERVETDFDLGGDFHFDPKRLAQLFANLLANALSYRRPGTPVRVRAVNDAHGNLEVAVSNEADPIPPETMARLFEPFSRGASSGGAKGLGLGLYIAAQIAKSHGGSLGAVSTDRETSFIFLLPNHCGGGCAEGISSEGAAPGDQSGGSF